MPGLPVVDEDGTLLGIVTESDLVLRGDEAVASPAALFPALRRRRLLEPLQHLEDKLRKASASTVEEMMTADVDTVSPQDSRPPALGDSSRAPGTIASPVVEGEKLVGVVTRVDALDALTRAGE